MSTEETILAQAEQKTLPEERAVFLDQACADDSALRQSVEHVRLKKGRQAMRVVFGCPSHGALYNGVSEFNWIRISKSGK